MSCSLPATLRAVSALIALLVLPLSRVLPQWNLQIAVPHELFVLMALFTLGTCIAASISSVVKVFRVPPASIFRG